MNNDFTNIYYYLNSNINFFINLVKYDSMKFYLVCLLKTNKTNLKMSFLKLKIEKFKILEIIFSALNYNKSLQNKKNCENIIKLEKVKKFS